MKLHSYDPECGRLAEYFLSDEGRQYKVADMDSLASAIQQTIKDWFQNVPEDEEPDPDRMLEDRRERDRDEWRHEAAEQQRFK